jgi:hypothetical protein
LLTYFWDTTLEVSAFGLLMGAFAGGEVFKIAAAIRDTQHVELGISAGDLGTVGICLVGSLGIYVAIIKLLK